jgi:hypothetical protein
MSGLPGTLLGFLGGVVGFLAGGAVSPGNRLCEAYIPEFIP